MTNGRVKPVGARAGCRRFRRILGSIAIAQTLFLLSALHPQAIAGRGQVIATTRDMVPGSVGTKDWPRRSAVAASDLNTSKMPPAVMGDQVTVQAAGRGLPWINLTDGRKWSPLT